MVQVLHKRTDMFCWTLPEDADQILARGSTLSNLLGWAVWEVPPERILSRKRVTEFTLGLHANENLLYKVNPWTSCSGQCSYLFKALHSCFFPFSLLNRTIFNFPSKPLLKYRTFTIWHLKGYYKKHVNHFFNDLIRKSHHTHTKKRPNKQNSEAWIQKSGWKMSQTQWCFLHCCLRNCDLMTFTEQLLYSVIKIVTLQSTGNWTI